jgi:hypothetical protein
MDSRRWDRPSQVRPRPPSTGRPIPARVKPIRPSPTRLGGYRRIQRGPGLPFPIKAVLAAAVLALGAAIVWIGAGQVGPFVASVAQAFGGIVTQVGNVATSPTPTEVPELSDSPTIDAPASSYTNDDVVDVTVNLPPAVRGEAGYTLRLYVTLEDEDPELVMEEPVGSTSVQVLVGVTLAKGRNDMQAAIMGPGGESERSEVATWILDQSKPKVSVISPKDNAQVNRNNVRVKGKSQAGAEIRVQNASNGAIATTIAGSDGLWETEVQVGNGSNPLTVTAIDPAGNENTTEVTVRKGSGKLTATLTGSAYRFKASRLPKPITLTVTVTDPDGRRLRGATALFTLTVPGLEAIVSRELTTNGDGVASFQTTIPAGATPGGGLATVLVTTDGDGSVTDRQVLTVTR